MPASGKFGLTRGFGGIPPPLLKDILVVSVGLIVYPSDGGVGSRGGDEGVNNERDCSLCLVR